MSIEQLFGKYRRLKKDLSAAYSQPQWNAALVDRLVEEIGRVEQELAQRAPTGLPPPLAKDEGRGLEA